MDIDSIVKKILEKNLSTYEQERLTVLNAIMGNIDLMMNKADEWFGPNIPEEYSRVIRSLFSLSAFLLEKKSNRFEVSKIEHHEDINITLFINRIINELRNILDFGEMKISSQSIKDDLIIRSSEIILKEAFYNIFFSIYPFMKNDSSCIIYLNENSMNISIEIIFDKLSDFYPGASEIKKNLYTYIQGSYEKIGIGIDSAITSLRNAGTVVKLNELQYKEKFSLTLLFPALEFYRDIESIRSENHKSHHNMYTGEIILMIQDPFMKLFVTDTLHEYGFSIISSSFSDLSLENSALTGKALILEYNDNLIENKELLNCISSMNLKKILICSENDNSNESCFNSFIKIIKPFNIEDIITKIEHV